MDLVELYLFLQMGFKLSNDVFVLGPVAIFPETILSWNVGSAKDINEESLSLFTALHPTLDVIVLGLETNYEYGKITEMKKLLIKHNIRVEILHVQQACGIYNFLVSERRYVAAGLIPPLPQKHKLGLKPAKMKELTT
ncbi:unnamed protein product [Xylocopa violacea]|uniref:NADH dehydrogenase [ubiquinone] 1 alpha subcomplex assembly factor 3 n=1 Tax=Xylocopa violacea TaxID=135666 RepID=A0ABP1NRF6_XYLVO